MLLFKVPFDSVSYPRYLSGKSVKVLKTPPKTSKQRKLLNSHNFNNKVNTDTIRASKAKAEV